MSQETAERMPHRRILLVDDESYITATIASRLRELGDNVMTGADGDEALEILKSFMPDLIVTDFQMPVMSGYEFAVALHNNPAYAAIPMILLTARGHALSDEQISYTGIRTTMAKPFSSRALVAKIEELIGPPRAGEMSVKAVRS